MMKTLMKLLNVKNAAVTCMGMSNVVWISDIQILTMAMINKIVKKFGQDRWFVQAELPTITLHTMNALVDKDYLEKLNFDDMLYYRRLKELDDN